MNPLLKQRRGLASILDDNHRSTSSQPSSPPLSGPSSLTQLPELSKSHSVTVKQSPLRRQDVVSSMPNIVKPRSDSLNKSQLHLPEWRVHLYLTLLTDTELKLKQLESLFNAEISRKKTFEEETEILSIMSTFIKLQDTFEENEDSKKRQARLIEEYGKRLQDIRLDIIELIQQAISNIRKSSFAEQSFSLKTRRFQLSRESLLSSQKAQEMSVEMLASVERELARKEQDYERSLKDRTDKIQLLKDTIQELKQLKSEKLKYARKENAAKEWCLLEKYSDEKQAVRDEIERLKQQLVIERKAHTISLEFLENQRLKVERDIESWMTKFEDDTDRMTEELESLKLHKVEMVEKYDQLQSDYDQLCEKVEDEKAALRREFETKRLFLYQTVMARRIQRWYRKRLLSKKKKAKSKKTKKK